MYRKVAKIIESGSPLSGTTSCHLAAMSFSSYETLTSHRSTLCLFPHLNNKDNDSAYFIKV